MKRPLTIQVCNNTIKTSIKNVHNYFDRVRQPAIARCIYKQHTANLQVTAFTDFCTAIIYIVMLRTLTAKERITISFENSNLTHFLTSREQIRTRTSLDDKGSLSSANRKTAPRIKYFKTKPDAFSRKFDTRWKCFRNARINNSNIFESQAISKGVRVGSRLVRAMNNSASRCKITTVLEQKTASMVQVLFWIGSNQKTA